MVDRLSFFFALGLIAAACGRDQQARSSNASTGGDLEAASVERAVGGSPNRQRDSGMGGSSPDGSLESGEVFVIEAIEFDGTTDLVIRDGSIFAIGNQLDKPADTDFVLEGRGLFLFPAVIDSHVHLSYYPVAEELALAGVLGAVDLAAPIESLSAPNEFLELISSGPMVTSLLGYPTQSWGRDGYGSEVGTVAEAEAVARGLILAGARVLKVPLDGDDPLSNEQVEAVVAIAHEAGVRVAVHALTESAVLRAAELGCDLLAHTPTQALSEEAVLAWKDGAVISTLTAFGAGANAVSNLNRLHEAGATVLYGTDLGNSRVVGINTSELVFLEQAGLSREESLAAMTTVPAAYWGMQVGSISKGGEANLLLLDRDPLESLETFANPYIVFYRGQNISSP